MAYLVRIEVEPDMSPFGLASIKHHTNPKAMAVLESDGKLLFETAYLKAVPVRHFYGMSDGKSFQQAHEFFSGGGV